MGDLNTHDVLEQLIVPPSGMLGIQGVAEVLGDVLKRAWLIKMKDDGSQEKPEFLNWVPDLIELCTAISDQVDVSGRWVEKPDADRQFKTAHPMYACLQVLSKKKGVSEGRLQLLAHALVAAHSGLLGTSDSSKMPPSNIQAAFRELRRLDSRVLDSVSFELPSRGACYQTLREVEQSEVSEYGRAELQQLGHIRRLIGLSLGLERPLTVASRSKTRGVPGSQFDEQVRAKAITPQELGDDGGEDFSLAEMSVSEPADIEVGRLDALAATDVMTEIRQILPSERANPKRGGSLQRGVFQARHIANQMRRGAQSLTARWDRLTEFEIDSVVSELSWQGAGRNPGVLAVGLVFLTGRPLSLVLNARLFSKEGLVPERISDDSMAICHEGAFIQVNVPVPERMRALRAEWQRSLHQTGNQLRLPVLTLLWNLLTDYIGGDESGWHGYLFPRVDVDDIMMSAKNFLADVRSEEGARVTITRLQRCIYNEIADTQGDAVDATFITGNQPATGTHVGTHYYCVPESDLQKRYLEATQGAVPDDFKDLMLPIRSRQNRPYLIGSPFCPKAEWINDLVSETRRQLKQSREKPLSADSLIELHNSLTVYVALFLVFSTGYRSVQAPLSRDTDYDPLSGMLVIADKTDSAFSHARLVPVPGVFAWQLDLYQQHRERVVSQLWALLGIKAPAHFLFFLDQASGGTKASGILVVVN
ncbi:MAG: hypothetical protein ABJM11_00010 [Marinobacter sp.]|uniref:hypothetical protein n=1 Tax=Marinobacter sp. TaxID=50741 RepID=UPI003297BC3D